MAQVIADRRDIEFVLYEQLDATGLCRHDPYRDFSRKAFDMIIDEARNLAVKEILPTYAEGDRTGVRFERGRVTVPQCFHRPFKLFVEGEWTALTADPELGGQGLPHTIAGAAVEYLSGANYPFAMYGLEGHSAGRLIEVFGTEQQKQMFVKKMYTGRWGGTMVLTEPEAGSDVGALTTTARKNPDGTYSISGNKIFITNGDHDLVENIIHPVLARIEGAPPGTRGISLFIVPKIWVHPDGRLGEANDVVCTGIEEKMGIHGSVTCSLAFGGSGKCRGLLLGEEHRGMRVMFQMMNEVRIIVGGIGLTCASAAYLHAAEYARNRRQGKDLERTFDPAAPQVPIVRHPDVRRMLLWMKAHVDGMRSLIYFGAHCLDLQKCAPTPEEKTYYQDLLELLTPIAKSYCSDRAFEVCSQAVQVHGGYGYTRDYPVEQLLRDVRIASIYEGTNGIQAMDLLGRKLNLKNGAVFMHLMQEIKKSIAHAKTIDGLEAMAAPVENAVERLEATTRRMAEIATSPAFKTAFAFALPFLDVMGDVIMAWMLLWRASTAAPRLERLLGSAVAEECRRIIEQNKNAAFYQGQLKTAEFFIHTILPVTLGKMNSIQAADEAVIEMPEAAF